MSKDSLNEKNKVNSCRAQSDKSEERHSGEELEDRFIRKCSSSSSDVRKSRKKMVCIREESLATNKNMDANDLYIKQLNAIQSRVNLLDPAEFDRDSKKSSVSYSGSDTLKSISNIRSAEHIDMLSDCSAYQITEPFELELEDFSLHRNVSNEMQMCQVSSTSLVKAFSANTTNKTLSPKSSLGTRSLSKSAELSSEKPTPRTIEIPPKKLCIRSNTPSLPTSKGSQPHVAVSKVKHKSIWTDTRNAQDGVQNNTPDEVNDLINDNDAASNVSIIPNADGSINLPNQNEVPICKVPLEPNIIIIGNDSDASSCSSIDKKDFHSKTLSRITSIPTPSPMSIDTKSSDLRVCDDSFPYTAFDQGHIFDTDEESLGERNVAHASNNCKCASKSRVEASYLEACKKLEAIGFLEPEHNQLRKEDEKNSLMQFCKSPSRSTIATNTYTVATLITNAKTLAKGIQRRLRLSTKTKTAQNMKKAKTPTANDDLEYFPDEIVVRTINYSDYILPLKKLSEIPDAKSAKDIVSSLAYEVFKSTGTDKSETGVSELQSEFELEDLVNQKSFKNISQELKRSPSIKLTVKFDQNQLVVDSKNAIKYKNIVTDRRPQTTDVGYYDVQNSLEGNIKLDDGNEDETQTENTTAETYDQEIFTCCLCLCRDFMFPKKRSRLF